MRKLLSMLLFLPALAAAADLPPAEPDALTTLPGWVIVEFSQPEACPNPRWDDTTRAALEAAGVGLVKVERDNRSVQLVLDGAPRTRAMALAYHDGARVDAVCGCPSSGSLAAWVAAMKQGHTYADLVPGLDGAALAIEARMERAKRSHCAGRFSEAFDSLEALWTRIPTELPDQRVLRLTRIARDIAMLAHSSSEVAARVAALRDGLVTAKDLDASALEDWIVLNRLLDDDARTFAWFEASVQDPARAELMAWQAPTYFDMLVSRSRWADAGALIDDAEAWYARDVAIPGTEARRRQVYAALLAAGRKADARKYAKMVLEATSGAEACALLTASTEARSPDSGAKPIERACTDANVLAAHHAALAK